MNRALRALTAALMVSALTTAASGSSASLALAFSPAAGNGPVDCALSWDGDMTPTLLEGQTATFTLVGTNNTEDAEAQGEIDVGNGSDDGVTVSAAPAPGFSTLDGNVTYDVTVTAEDTGNATITPAYSVTDEDGGSICDGVGLPDPDTGDPTSAPNLATIDLSVLPYATTTVWDAPGPTYEGTVTTGAASSWDYYPGSLMNSGAPQAYVLQSGGGSSGIGSPKAGPPGSGYSSSGQYPVPYTGEYGTPGYVICGAQYEGNDSNGHLRVFPIACPIAPQALAAGFSMAANSPQLSAHGQNCGPQQIVDGVYQWNDNDWEDSACSELGGAGALYTAPDGGASQLPGYTLVEVTPNTSQPDFCPQDSVVVGGYFNGDNVHSNSVGEIGCAQIRFPRSATPPPPPPPPPPTPPATSTPPLPSSTIPLVTVTLSASPATVILGATTTLWWDATVATTTATGTSFDDNASPARPLAFMNIARADAAPTSTPSNISCGFTGGSDASGPLPSSGLTNGESYVVTPASPGVQTYSMTCGDPSGKLQGNATTTITVIPPGMITVDSLNSVTDAGVTSTWTFAAPADSSLDNCNAASDPACAGSSATYPDQPAGATSTYTISAIGDPIGYSFDSAASNGGYNAADPMAQTLQPGSTDVFNLVWDPIASMSITPPSLALTAASPSGQATITNNGTDGSTLGSIVASMPPADSAWLSVSDTSGISLGAGDSANMTVVADPSAAPSSCSSSGGCTVPITFTGNSSPGAGSPSEALTVTYYGTVAPPPCTGVGCDATAMIGASSTQVSLGSPTTLTWSSTNASGCSASSDSPGAGDLSSISGTSGSQAVSPTTAGTKDYTISCPSVFASDGGTPGVDAVSVSVTQGSTTCEMAGDCQSPPAQVNISLASTTIAQGSATKLSWNTLYAAETCTASGAWSGSEPNQGSAAVSQPGTYRLTCPAADGTDASGADSATLTVTGNGGGQGGNPTSSVAVAMAPSSQEIQIGGAASFSWYATSTPDVEPVSCAAASSPQENDGWNGTAAPSAGSTAVTPDSLGTHTYSLTCTNGADVSGAGSVAVDVDSAQECAASGDCNGGGGPDVTLTPQTQLIAPGGTATITWSSSNASGCTASAGTGAWPGAKAPQGSQSFVLQNVGTYHYDMYCSDSAGASSTTEAATVRVQVQNPTTVSLLSNGYPESTIDRGESVTLTWTTADADACTASTDPATGGGSGWAGSEPTQNANGTAVTPTEAGTYTYALSCTNGSGSAATGTTVVNVHSNPPSCSFGASPSSIVAGAAADLSWSCNAGAASCTLNGTAVSPTGNESVTPSQTTTYTLSCSGQDGSYVATTTVAVGAPGFREVNP